MKLVEENAPSLMKYPDILKGVQQLQSDDEPKVIEVLVKIEEKLNEYQSLE